MERHWFIYDPFKKEIDFRYRRPTDYKLNKRIFLPRPLNELDEFQCEIKRRRYAKVFDDFDKENTGPKDEAKKMTMKEKKNDHHFLNLSFKERKGLRTLNDRINKGEIMVTPTDKSGRFAVLTTDQYLESGRVHASKDQKIGWGELK